MTIFRPTLATQLKFTSLMLAVATASACTPTAPLTSTPTGLTAGGTSSHTPQNYEATSSTAGTTSTLGGSAILVRLAGTTSAPAFGVVSTTGLMTHSLGGKIQLSDGTYLFVDSTGPDASGHVVDDASAGNTGLVAGTAVSPVTDFSGYTYVTPYALDYTIASGHYLSIGVAGMITNAADMPSAGSASYTGKAYAAYQGPSTSNEFGNGISTVNVDFASGSANVNLHNFANITVSSGGSILASAAPFDQIQGSGLVVSGAHITGGTWVTMHNGVPVHVVGANETSVGNATFFGYDPSISAPDQVGGVVVIGGGAGAAVIGMYIAD